MKIIQTYWSKPSLKKNLLHMDDRHNGGWISPKDHYLSWALSCLKLTSLYDKVELYTDEFGYHILLDILKLPYTKVHVGLDNSLNSEFLHEDFWTLGKIFCYGIQDEPFIHVDSDIYIWEKFSERLSNSQLLVQNLEINHDFYFEVVNLMKENFQLPKWIIPMLNREKIIAANTGIVGGKNFMFFKNYSKIIFEILETNREKLHLINKSLLSITLEQLIMVLLSEIDGYEISCLLNPNYGNYYDLTTFHLVSKKTSYIHAIGSNNKKSIAILFHLENRLRIEFPDYYFYFISNVQKINSACSI